VEDQPLELDLASFKRVHMRSEQVRTLCMLFVFSVFAGYGALRTALPLEHDPLIGRVVLVASFPYLILEIIMLRLVGVAVRSQQILHPKMFRFQTIAECLFPVVGTFAAILFAAYDPFTALVSPGYAFIFILITLSILRLDPFVSILTGIAGTTGYGSLVIYVLVHVKDVASPHPDFLYVHLAAMLVIATVAVTFISTQVRNYVVGAVREVETRRVKDHMERDMQLARELQQNLLPAAMPELTGFDIAAMSRPAQQTGGDYFDWQAIDDKRVVLTLADVTGHGVGPALVTAACRAYFRATVERFSSLPDVMEHVNCLLFADLPDDKFVTCAMVELNVETNKGSFLSAGLGPSLHIKAATGQIITIGVQGLPMGLVQEITFDPIVDLELEIGDVVVLLSDGFYEWSNTDEEPFGLDRIGEAIVDNLDRSSDEIVAAMDLAVQNFVGDRSQVDDMTTVVIKRTSDSQA
jgi:hypothetical protein